MLQKLNDFDFESNITSYHLDMNVYKKNPRTFDELISHLNNNGKDGKKLFRNIEKLMYYVSQAIDSHLYQSKNIKGTVTFQLFGGDVIFDNNMHPYLLEFNKGPDMIPKNKKDALMKSKIEIDMLQKEGLIEIKKIDYVNEFYLV